MDDITKRITMTQNQIIQVLNDSGLHPMVLSLILAQIQNQVSQAVSNTGATPEQAKNDNIDDHTEG